MALSMLYDGKVIPVDPPAEHAGTETPETGTEAPDSGTETPETEAPETGTEKPETETEKPETGTEKPETETEKPETEKPETGTEKPETETEKPETGTKKRDWVEEAYTCFIKDAGSIDPTDPVKAIEAYFQKNATDELKARCKAEGKDAKGCWRFVEEVARKALHGSSGHIDPAVVYAIAMHWFEDVPKDWDKKAERSSAVRTKPKKPTTRKERLEERVAHGSSKAKAELRELKKKERAKAKPNAKRKPKLSQGFFFEMLETPETESEVRG